MQSYASRAKNVDGKTGFHLACLYGNARIVGVIMDYVNFCDIDYSRKDLSGRTGFQLAKLWRKLDVIDLIKNKIHTMQKSVYI